MIETNDVLPALAGLLNGATLRMAYQPIVDLDAGEVVGHEALLRVERDGLLSGPGDLLQRSRDLGEPALLQAAALRGALRRRVELLQFGFVAVNVSPDVIAHPSVRAVFDEVDDLAGVVVELTELNLTGLDDEHLAQELQRLRDRGARIAIDDAGTGYSGLARIGAVQPEIIKLDRSVVHGIADDPVKRDILLTMLSLGQRMCASILAEGVERAEDLDALAEIGVPLVQGFLVGRPAPELTTANPAVLAALRGREHAPSGSLDTLLEEVGTAESYADGFDRMRWPSPEREVVIVDRVRRPIGLVTPSSARQAVEIMPTRFPASTPIRDALSVALRRTELRRFDPVAVVDGGDHLIGVVRVDRMMLAVLDATLA